MVDGQLAAEEIFEKGMVHGRELAPAIKRVSEKTSTPLEDVDLIAVDVGPGSFTGLRVGITAAKTLAYALEIPVLGVNTLDAIAFQAFYPLSDEDQGPFADLARPLAVVMNAQRGQFFSATFSAATGRQCKTTQSTHLVDQQQWLKELDSGMTVSGPGLSLIEDSLPQATMVVAAARRLPRAAAIAQLAQQRYLASPLAAEDLQQQSLALRPEYYRRSAAEEKRGPC